MQAATVLASFHQQIGWCEKLGSPFSAEILRLLATDVADGGRAAALVGDWPGDPVADALPLRLLGALHALVLDGRTPALAASYPPHATTPELLRALLRDTLDEHADTIRGFLTSPPQTNEVGRSAVLLGGFLHIAAETGLPLRLLEIGASAGLNLMWDKFGYRLGAATWGDANSPVLLTPDWHGPLPRLDAPVSVVERWACDVAPIDLEDAGQRKRLRAYVWADQRERLARLDGAIAVARAAGVRVDRADAAHWLAGRLAHRASGQASVVYHSIMWQYMPAVTQQSIRQMLADAGRAATADAPFAWLRFELAASDAAPELRVTLWPDGRDVRLAEAHPHGATVNWIGR